MSSSEAHDTLVKAAQRLSSARKHRQHFLEAGDIIHGQERVETAKEAYNAAYKLFTNPYGVSKWVT